MSVQSVQKKHNLSVLITAGQLFRKEMSSFYKQLVSKLVDAVINVSLMIIVFGYFIQQQIGSGNNFGPFILIGTIASLGFWDTLGKVGDMITDFSGPRTITYTLSLPMPSWLALSVLAVSWAVTSLVISCSMLPVGKLLLYNKFDLSIISYWRLGIMFICSHLFFGFFSLWLVSILKGANITTVWLRVINPLYTFGCFWYSWKTMGQISPVLSSINLINPLVYVMEGFRAATLGQEGYMPFWICAVALLGFTFLCAVDAISRLRKQLDFV
ncbi:MAG: ABC transporter permease [Oligoflexia bacterium]|nr:ABC transporter permease [Oligoflexia bacterium]